MVEATALTRRTMRNRLAIRLAALIVIVGPVAFVVIMNVIYLAGRLVGEPQLQNGLWVIVALIATPLTVGAVAAGYLNRRLRQFVNAIAALQANNYRIKVKPSGIREFDDIALQFNQVVRQLEREEELRKNLISDTSHELNTPLAAMLSQISAMRENILQITPERLKVLLTQVERLIAMIDELDHYTVARLPIKHMEPISLYEVAQSVQKHTQVLLDKSGTQLIITVPPKLTIVANRTALEHILVNVISNATKYAKGTQITIASTPSGFFAADNGVGVSEKDRPFLFERFYRVDKSRSRTTGGLGLGLAIVRELAMQQGWKVQAVDANPGLKIIFTLPK